MLANPPFSRRLFLKSLSFLAITAGNPLTRTLLGTICLVTREVTFAREMTFEEYESLGALYCDSQSISSFTNKMKESGELIDIYHDFSSTKIVYTLIFRDVAAYQKYLQTIDANWVNFSEFAKLGFQVNVRQLT